MYSHHMARVYTGSPEDIRINPMDEELSDFYMCPNKYEHTIKIDQRISKALEGTTPGAQLMRLTFMTSTGPVVAGGETRLALYFLDPVSFGAGTASDAAGGPIAASASNLGVAVAAAAAASAPAAAFANGPAAPVAAAAATTAAAPTPLPAADSSSTLPRVNSLDDIWSISTGKFLVSKSATVRERYTDLLNKAMATLAPVIRFFEKDGQVMFVLCTYALLRQG